MHEPGRGEVLISIAREAIRDEACPVIDAWPEPWLREAAATFVTLTLDGELRGCIGSLEARRELCHDVAHNARAAAHDSRFPPLPRERLAHLGVEVSVLSPREALPAATEAQALALLRPGIDGVVIEYGAHCATFLPQVWDHLPEPGAFLAELRRKARLPGRFWHEDLKLSRYTVEKFR